MRYVDGNIGKPDLPYGVIGEPQSVEGARRNTPPTAFCFESCAVNTGEPGRDCHQRWPEFRVNDSEANNSPRPERARGQEHVGKAGNSRRCVRCGPATPERYGEDWIV